MEEGASDLSNYTTTEACYGLIDEVRETASPDDPYLEPYCRYVSMWPTSVPLKCIVIGQDPYPNDIFSHTSAAMSYDDNKCSEVMKRAVPPTVAVLANDLYVNAGVEKSITIQCVKDGWRLASKGVLLVNNIVLGKWSEFDWRNSIRQIAVLVRLLHETEKYGKDKVTIFAMGNSAEKTLNEITSTFKSSVIGIIRQRVAHPASLSYRYTNLNDPTCHMESETFSKRFAENVCNQVAYQHIVASRRNSEQIKLRHFADTAQQTSDAAGRAIQDMNNFVDA